MIGDIPLVILGGSDRTSGRVPHGAEKLHFVVGYKGADYRVGGVCLAQLLAERVRRSGAYGTIYLVGPRHVYEDVVDCEIIDSDGSLAENLERAVARVCASHGATSPIAFLACDVLPEPGEIAELTAQLASDEPDSPVSEENRPLPAFALPIIYAERELGASSWKPKYPFRPAPGADPVPFLGGHLAIIRPTRLRMGLVYRLLQIAYDERNRDDYDTRTRRFVVRTLGALLYRDFLNVIRFRAPTLTCSVLRHGLGTYWRWRRRELDVDGLALGLAGVLVRRRYFRRWGGRNVRLVTTPFMSFAKDIDTREELEELSRHFGAGKGS